MTANNFIPTNNKKILLMVLPFWDPLVPPQGISYLKFFLQHHGYIVRTKDCNTMDEFKTLYHKYFGLLKQFIPGNKQGNFFNIGHDVMRNHMTAHIHNENEKKYKKLVQSIVYNTYFTRLSDAQITQLNDVWNTFYSRLEKYISRLLEKEKPDVLGISVLRDCLGPSMFAFRVAKTKCPFIKTVMGGSIFSDHLLPGTPNFDYFLEKAAYIDKIIIGEGQILFLKWLEGQLPDTQRVLTLKDINFRTLGYTSLNYPDMSDFNVTQDYPYLSAHASSSCPYQCSFCNVKAFFGEYREKDPQQVIEEMTNLYKKYGIQLFFMNDALVNSAAPALSEEFLKTDIPLYWDGYLRVGKSVCDFNNTLQWRKGGFYRSRLGVESGSQHVLDMMHKGITPQQSKEALLSLSHAGIKTTAYWVIGHPGETEGDFLQTLELLQELKDHIFEAECNPFIFGYHGQSDSENWKNKRKPLYSDDDREMLIIQSWVVDTEPSREELYQRVNRFVQRCQELDIPNPYSLHDIYQADKRWQRLHKNAVPALVDFKTRDKAIDECRNIKQFFYLETPHEEEGDFDF